MEKTNFKDKQKNSARLIDEAGFAAYNAIGTDGFLRAFTRLLEVFKKEYATYLYAEAGIDLIADLLNTVLYPEQTTIVLLETMAGKGTECGRTTEELSNIINQVNNNLNYKVITTDLRENRFERLMIPFWLLSVDDIS